MNISPREFLLLYASPREVLIDIIVRLSDDLERLKTPLELPIVDVCGFYVVTIASGVERFRGSENDFLLKDAETIAAVLSSRGGYCSITFELCGVSELVSEWSNGGRVVRAN